jgi:hypothetical protein
LFSRSFDARTNVFEEIIAQRGFGAVSFPAVGNHRAAFAGSRVDAPGEILLDADGVSGSQRAIQAVRPVAVIR